MYVESLPQRISDMHLFDHSECVYVGASLYEATFNNCRGFMCNITACNTLQ